MKTKFLAIVILGFLIIFVIGQSVVAKTIEEGLNETASTANLITGSQSEKTGQELVQSKIGEIIKAVLSMIGIIFFVLVMYGGLQWMLAGGDKEKVATGRNYIIYSALGLGLIALSYGIANYLINLLGTQTMK